MVVVGGGIVGAATAWALARGDGRPPAKVLLLESRRPGHDRGSSHGDGRIVRFTYPETVYLEMARRAFPLWREIEKKAATRCSSRPAAGNAAAGARRSWPRSSRASRRPACACRRYSAAESRRRFPQFELPLGSSAIYQPEGAVVRAGAAVAALWRAAGAAGAALHAEERVLEIVPGEPAAVRTERTTYRAAAVVLAAGAWAGPLLRSLGLDLPLQPSREVVAYFQVAARSASGMVDHRVGSMPALIDYHTDPPFYALPQGDVPGSR